MVVSGLLVNMHSSSVHPHILIKGVILKHDMASIRISDVDWRHGLISVQELTVNPRVKIVQKVYKMLCYHSFVLFKHQAIISLIYEKVEKDVDHGSVKLLRI